MPLLDKLKNVMVTKRQALQDSKNTKTSSGIAIPGGESFHSK
jgi:glutamine amidotransferase PdxT